MFGRKQKGHLGIDFGAGGIKVIQLQKREGEAKLFTYGFSEFTPEETSMDYLENPQGAGELLKKICAKARTTTTSAAAALPIPSVFSAVISIAQVPKKEISAAVQWEAKKLVPLPLDEVVLDFKELKVGKETPPPRSEGSGVGAPTPKASGSIEVLLTAAPKSIIERYLAVAKSAGITLTSLETEAFALIRALLGSDPTPTVIVDIGALRSNILVVDRGIPMLTRSVEIGGKKCTEAIAQGMGVTLTQAEAMKRDLGSVPLPGGALSATTATVPGGLPALLQEVFQPLLNELRYSFNVYRTRNVVARQVERIMLTGGGAGIPGLAEFLTGEFNLRAFLGNPWEKVGFHPDLKDHLDAFGTKFSVAVGVALRNL